MSAALEAVDLCRSFRTPSGQVPAVVHASFTVAAGEVVALQGRSGSGKTTLLNLMGGLDRPTSGKALVAGRDLAELDAGGIQKLRRTHLSFVFQSFGLLPELTAAENVEVPLRLMGVAAPERAARVEEALRAVGLTRHAGQTPGQLSGGQRQRVGLARAVITEPTVLLADEPTGQLDSATGLDVMAMLHDLAHARGVAALVATHDPLLLRTADRVLTIHDGVIQQA